jgi:hypothetical protein
MAISDSLPAGPTIQIRAGTNAFNVRVMDG